MVAHLGSWQAPPLALGGLGLAAVLFAQAFVRLRRRGRADLTPASRAVLFGLALALAVVVLVSPLDRVAERSLLSAHMLQHVLLGDAAPALGLVAIRGPLLFFALPPAVLGPLARSPRVRAALATLSRPRVAWTLWAANLGVWHVPALYDAALRHPLLHDLEHACWLLAGLLVWTLLVDPAGRGRVSVGGRIALAVALFAAGQALSDVLVFSFRPLYPAYEGAYGISGQTDQQLAGLVMMVEQLLTLGTCVALLLRPRWARRAALA